VDRRGIGLLYFVLIYCIPTNYVKFLKFLLFSILLNSYCPGVCNITIFSADFFFNRVLILFSYESFFEFEISISALFHVSNAHV